MKKQINTDYPNLFEMSKFIGYYTLDSVIKNSHFSGRSLSFEYDLEVQDIKNRLLNLTKKLVGLDLAYKGYILNSGSDCNEIAMVLSRRLNNKNTVVCSNLSHSSIKNRAAKIGMKVISLDVNPKTFKINLKDGIKGVYQDFKS